MKEFLKLDLNQLFNYILDNIEYGWIDTKNRIHYGSNNDDLEYHLQTPEETLERKIGICLDTCELLRYYFEKNNYKVMTYFIYIYITDDYCPSHSMVVFKNKNNIVWFEPSNLLTMGGIHYYSSEEDFIKDMKKKFIENGLKKNFFTTDNDLKKIYCYEFKKPNFGIRGSEYYDHCRKGRKIDL